MFCFDCRYCSSLNVLKREREQERIAEENLEFAKRLEQVKPKYDVHDWVRALFCEIILFKFYISQLETINQ